MKSLSGKRWLALLGVALPLLAGTALRLWNLAGQILGGDELHAVRVALALPIASILTTYQPADSSIPLTALDRLLLDHGVALGEGLLRLPALACGLLALALLPAAAAGRIDARAVALLRWLLALSPLLVFYSRIARSYMPVVLLAWMAALSFGAWWRTGARRAALGYVAAAALAVWLHLGAAPFAVAPLLFALGDLTAEWLRARRPAAGPAREQLASGLPRRTAGKRLRDLALLAAGLAAACALFLAPAHSSLAQLVAAKRQAQAIPLATWLDVVRLQAGSARPAAAVLFWGAALAGAATLLRRRPRLAAYTLVLAAAQLAGILALSPLGLAEPLVLDRYFLPVLPLVLLWVACGLARPWWPNQGPLGRAGQRLGAYGLVAALAAAGPFADPALRTSSFAHHNDFVDFVRPRDVVPAGVLPQPYRALGGGAVVEFPWPPAWDFGRAFYAYQEIHGQRVLAAAPPGFLQDPRLRWRNLVPPDPRALATLAASPGPWPLPANPSASPPVRPATAPPSLGSAVAARSPHGPAAVTARWLVIHSDLGAEEDRLFLPGRGAAAGPPRRAMPPPQRRVLHAEAERLAARLQSEWGSPAYSDGVVKVWDLARVARRLRPR